jgi:hypothetical protein
MNLNTFKGKQSLKDKRKEKIKKREMQMRSLISILKINFNFHKKSVSKQEEKRGRSLHKIKENDKILLEHKLRHLNNSCEDKNAIKNIVKKKEASPKLKETNKFTKSFYYIKKLPPINPNLIKATTTLNPTKIFKNEIKIFPKIIAPLIENKNKVPLSLPLMQLKIDSNNIFKDLEEIRKFHQLSPVSLDINLLSCEYYTVSIY